MGLLVLWITLQCLIWINQKSTIQKFSILRRELFVSAQYCADFHINFTKLQNYS